MLCFSQLKQIYLTKRIKRQQKFILYTVKLGYNELGYNELGYNEHSVITNKYIGPKSPFST